MFEVFDHTADLGLRIEAESEAELFAEAGRALMSVLVANTENIQATQHRHLELPPDERELLFFDWLNELLYWFETDHWLASRFEVSVDSGIQATVHGEPAVSHRHELAHEVKAITYHQLKVTQSKDGHWHAEVILDI